jgi:hypothetical protein
MFRGSEKGLKEDPLCFLGVPRVRSRVKRNHANEAQTRNQEKLWRTPEPIVVSDSMDTVMQPGST